MTAPLEIPKYFLYPCMLFAHREEHQASTLLGSCVSVCLWDTRLHFGGLNHYMLPLWTRADLPTPKYGNVAIGKLLEKMLLLGSRQEDLVAKVFGGASLFGPEGDTYRIGDRNVMVARELLKKAGIEIIASRVGGTSGIRIHFNTRTGVVMAGRIASYESQQLPEWSKNVSVGRY